jgi:hypothetical protein
VQPLGVEWALRTFHLHHRAGGSVVKQLVDVIDNGRLYRLDIPKSDSPGHRTSQLATIGGP